MKIVKIENYVLERKLSEPFGWAMDWIDNRVVAITKITTDEGLVGWGEGGGAPSAFIINSKLSPLLIGEDPLNINNLWHKMYHSLYNAGYTGGFAGDAISGVDIALWDIAGKSCGKSVAEMLGGALRDKIAVYATGLYYKKEDSLRKLLEEAEGYLEKGFLGMKTKIGGMSLKEDYKRIEALRNCIGEDKYLMVDANQSYNAATAINMGRMISDLDIHWFEEPVHSDDLEAYLQVKAEQPIQIAGGEILHNRFESKDLIARRAVDVIQPDVERIGGITGTNIVCNVANTFGIPVSLHSWGSSINTSASLNISAVLPSTPYSYAGRPFEQEPVMEFDQTENPIRNELCDVVFEIQDGHVNIPNGPGLGVEVDESTLERFCVNKFVFV